MYPKRNIDTQKWISNLKENIKKVNPAIKSNELNSLLAHRLQLRDHLNRKKAMSLRTPPAYNLQAVLDLPIPVRNVHSNNSAQWASIIGERELMRNPYIQSNRLDSLIANQVQAAYVGRERRRQQRQLEKQYVTRKKPKSVKPNPRQKSIKRKPRFFGNFFGK